MQKKVLDIKHKERLMSLKKKQDQVESKSVLESKAINKRRNGTLIEELTADLASHNDAVRMKARHSLVAMGRIAVPPLVEALKNKNNLVRWETAKALGEIGDPETVPALIKALEDEDFDVRWLAAEGLIRMNINALKPLLQALENKGDSILLQEGAHHVFHDLAKGALRRYLVPVLAALERLEPGTEVPWVARHDMGVEVPLAARQALNMLEKTKTI
jgi:HEAT repeat protein